MASGPGISEVLESCIPLLSKILDIRLLHQKFHCKDLSNPTPNPYLPE